MKPKSPKNATATAKLAAENRGLANTVTSSIGSRRRRSQTTNVVKMTANTAKLPRVTGSVQPRCGASITV